MSTYCIVTPVRNEEEHLSELVESLVAQTVRPSHWVLVDDGSSDSSAAMIDQYASQHDWLTLLQRPDRGQRAPGGGVVETFMTGYELVKDDEWDFVVKLDADMSLDPDFFERCLERFAADPQLGIGGGTVSDRLNDGTLRHDPHPAFHVRGATKIYRRECWEAIGGMVQAKGWDTIDEVKANQLGWRTTTFHDIPILQQRVTGHRAGSWSDISKNGRAAWFCGYHPLFALARAVRLSTIPPYLLLGLAFASGYGKAMLTRADRIDDPELISYVQREQLNRLRGRPSIWR